MGLSYADVKAIIADVLQSQSNEAELVALRAENQQLKSDIASAVDKTDAIETGAREGLPPTQ